MSNKIEKTISFTLTRQDLNEWSTLTPEQITHFLNCPNHENEEDAKQHYIRGLNVYIHSLNTLNKYADKLKDLKNDQT